VPIASSNSGYDGKNEVAHGAGSVAGAPNERVRRLMLDHDWVEEINVSKNPRVVRTADRPARRRAEIAPPSSYRVNTPRIEGVLHRLEDHLIGPPETRTFGLRRNLGGARPGCGHA